MKLNKKILGLLAIPVVAGVVGVTGVVASTTHAEQAPSDLSSQTVDTPEPGDTPDSGAEDNNTGADVETNE